VVVSEIGTQGSFQMPRVEHDEMVQAVPAERADQALDVGILPGTPGGGEHCFYREGGDSQTNLIAVDTVSISEQILGRILVSEGLDDLLGRLGCTGMLRHMEMQHLATTMFQHQEHEQHLHRDRRHGEEVYRDHLSKMIVQEGLPGLAGPSRPLPEQPGDGPFRDLDAEHLQLAVNPRGPPQRIGRSHLLHQTSNLEGSRGSAATALVASR